ncbi:Uncharacterised protein [Bacteroides caccae]|uniref:Uncharacterized protein n=1 Tax=Bacteroides caccae TaxID=47678 RepID=A0A174XEA8_9BACE|nr:hypothetical protein [Bacteroides caccae]CUQ55996.1 Uncharacterised protein [Bacteroides caccae]
MKEDRRLRNLRYQMRKKGYQFDTKNLVAIMPSHDKRSLLQERRLSKFGFSIQCNMFEQ